MEQNSAILSVGRRILRVIAGVLLAAFTIYICRYLYLIAVFIYIFVTPTKAETERVETIVNDFIRLTASGELTSQDFDCPSYGSCVVTIAGERLLEIPIGRFHVYERFSNQATPNYEFEIHEDNGEFYGVVHFDGEPAYRFNIYESGRREYWLELSEIN